VTQFVSLIFIIAAIFVASLQLPVFYRANPDYVKSMATVAALQEFRRGDLISNEAARIPASRDQVAVTITMKEMKDTAADGLLAKQEINYALRLKTSSHCLELQPGCLQVKEKRIFQTVSLKTPI
jgi:hypothetical protein